jgi:RNA polymerase sigma-70 factor (ECF subfamily)
MRDDETTTIGVLVHRAVEGDPRATHDLLAHVHPLALRYCRARLSRVVRGRRPRASMMHAWM